MNKAIVILCAMIFGPLVWGFLQFMAAVGL